MTIAVLIALALTGTPAAASPPVEAPAAKQAGWNVYRNARFGTRISYPGWFARRRESANGDGITLTAADGGELAVWGAYNATGESPRAYLATAAGSERGRVTYRTAGSDFAVYSGTEGGNIFYERLVFDGRTGVHGYRLTYPRRLQARYAPIIARLSRTLSYRRVD